MPNTINTCIVNPYYTLIVAVIVIWVGYVITKHIPSLEKYSIPEPVTGGLCVALFLLILHHVYGFDFSFNEELKNFCMLSFFASIGLSADLHSVRKGGKPLVIFVICLFFFLLVQDIVGIACTYFFKSLHPFYGLILGSIPLSGGHSTASSWGGWFEKQYHLIGASNLSIAAATYGLVAGGLLGGPIAHLLMRKITPNCLDEIKHRQRQDFILFENHDQNRLITTNSMLEVLAMFALCLSVSYFITDAMNSYFPDSKLRIPPFVWALLTGVILRNTLTYGFNYEVFDRNVDVFGNVTLNLFLAMALISLHLWELSDLGAIASIILLIQTIVVILYIYFITFRIMGADYDAIILCAGQCGFGLGATPTAIANMQSLTDHYGPSPKAFLLVPIVGAFFIDIMNALVLTFFQYILV